MANRGRANNGVRSDYPDQSNLSRNFLGVSNLVVMHKYRSKDPYLWDFCRKQGVSRLGVTVLPVDLGYIIESMKIIRSGLNLS